MYTLQLQFEKQHHCGDMNTKIKMHIFNLLKFIFSQIFSETYGADII